jgi:hypothetical protein
MSFFPIASLMQMLKGLEMNENLSRSKKEIGSFPYCVNIVHSGYIVRVFLPKTNRIVPHPIFFHSAKVIRCFFQKSDSKLKKLAPEWRVKKNRNYYPS